MNDVTRVRAGMEIASWEVDHVLWERFERDQRRRTAGATRRSEKRLRWTVGLGALATGGAAAIAEAVASAGGLVGAVGVLVGMFVVLPFAISVGRRRQARPARITFTSTGVLFDDRARLYRDDSHCLARAQFFHEQPSWILLDWHTLQGAPAELLEIPVPYRVEADVQELVEHLLAHKASLAGNHAEPASITEPRP